MNSERPPQERTVASSSRASLIEGVFFAEFDNVVGPKLVCQTPPACLSADEFSAIETFIITGPDLVGKIVSLVAFGRKIVGFPVRIESSRYHRNALLFNTCFVLPADRPTAAFEPILRKLAASFSSLEAECQFISSAATKSRLHDMLPRILEGLNVRGECVLSVDAANSINLKLFPEHRPPADVLDHQVPLLTKELDATTTGDWDLALLEVLPFIDGLRHVKRIATDAAVDVELVRTAVRQLVYYECAQLLDIFQFSATYCCTHLISRLANTPRMQRECVEYVCEMNGVPYKCIFCRECFCTAALESSSYRNNR